MHMDTVLETIDLDVEEATELLFKVKVEGAGGPAKVRLVCETGDMALMFNGRATPDDGVIQFQLPVLKDKVKEGVYPCRVEVLVENRHFVPLNFNVNVKKVVHVVAEAVTVARPQPQPQVTVAVQPVKRPSPPQPSPVQSKQSATLKERYDAKKPTFEVDEDLVRQITSRIIRSSRRNNT